MVGGRPDPAARGKAAGVVETVRFRSGRRKFYVLVTSDSLWSRCGRRLRGRLRIQPSSVDSHEFVTSNRRTMGEG